MEKRALRRTEQFRLVLTPVDRRGLECLADQLADRNMSRVIRDLVRMECVRRNLWPPPPMPHEGDVELMRGSLTTG